MQNNLNYLAIRCVNRSLVSSMWQAFFHICLMTDASWIQKVYLLDNYLAGNIDVNIIFKVYYEVKYVKFLVNNVSSSFKTVCIKQFGL